MAMDDLDDPCMLAHVSLMIFLSFNLLFSNDVFNCYKTYFIRRTRASVSAIMYELGSKSNNYYRMSDASFWKLHNKLKENIDKKEYNVSRRCRKKRRQNFVPNGVMHSSTRLSIALRIFAGADVMDVALVHGVSTSEVKFSIWKVVDAIHLDKGLNINFPEKYEEQRRVANGFKAISTAEFDNCAGCMMVYSCGL